MDAKQKESLDKLLLRFDEVHKREAELIAEGMPADKAYLKALYEISGESQPHD